MLTTHMTLTLLVTTPPGLAFYDVVMLARDPSYKPFGNAPKQLHDLGLLDADGRLHGSVREIILACAEGDGLQMCLLPLKEVIKGATSAQRDEIADLAEMIKGIDSGDEERVNAAADRIYERTPEAQADLVKRTKGIPNAI